ncbi:TniB family NTP-binding protein [Pseudomonas sp.]|uniref:TniB family NTP-binding protein n=1 Tax=Pseudomonas sp. TaxID=306 RepID=UPI0028A8B240|nr:TniB family NTP-binding protein [Pseudomonas sp.]
MTHLSPRALALLELPREERAIACMRDVFLNYPSAMAVEQSAKRLIASPRNTSNAGMSLIALPGLGKSSIGVRWEKQSFEAASDWPGKIIYLDLVKNSANLSIMKLFLAAIGERFHTRPLNLSYRDVALAKTLVREHNVRGVFVDEAAMLRLALTGAAMHRELGSIKGMAGHEWQLNMFLSGTPDDMYALFDNDATLKSRFNIRVGSLSYWRNDAEGRSFVHGYLALMPLEQPSVLNDDFFKVLEDNSLTITTVRKKEVIYNSRRAVTDLVRETCRTAVETGQEYVNTEILVSTINEMKNVIREINLNDYARRDMGPKD